MIPPVDYGGMIEALVRAVLFLLAAIVALALAFVAELVFGLGWSFWRWVLVPAGMVGLGVLLGMRLRSVSP